MVKKARIIPWRVYLGGLGILVFLVSFWVSGRSGFLRGTAEETLSIGLPLFILGNASLAFGVVALGPIWDSEPNWEAGRITAIVVFAGYVITAFLDIRIWWLIGLLGIAYPEIVALTGYFHTKRYNR